MKIKLNEWLKKGIIATALISLPYNEIHADDFLKGVKGPTNFQIDGRFSYSKNNKNIESLTNNLILKYWDGDKNGKWGFINFPYKSIKSENNFNNGFGDINAGFGLRGKIKNFNYFLYESLTIPTGNSELSNKRYDLKTGAFITYLTKNKKFEVDGVFEYNLTGKNNSGINSVNEFYSSIFFGRAIGNKIRIGTGLTDLIKTNGDFVLNSRTAVRYAPSSKIHFEIVGDIGMKTKNIPKFKGLGVFARYNF